MPETLAATVKLNDGHEFPAVGLGVYQAKGKELVTAIQRAVESGYRHIDCAALYGNEREVAAILRDMGDSWTEKVTVTTKVWNDKIRAGKTREAVEHSLRIMRRDRLDVVLVHWPAEGYRQSWEDLQSARQDGVIRSIGVSNFMPQHLNTILAENGTVPCINQIEHHPYLPQRDARDLSQAHGILPVAHTPLMQGEFLRESAFQAIAEEVQRTPAQVLLRWNLQRGVAVIPKSVTPSRITENIGLFDFTLSTQQMTILDHLKRNRRFSGDPENVSF